MRITRENTVGVIIDVQERLLPVIHEQERVRARIETIVRGLATLNLPLLWTEQYPKGLGSTVASLAELLTPYRRIEKNAFSCCDDDRFSAALAETGRRIVLIAGVESHVCVLQTCLDLLEGGYTPVVVADAVSSRNPLDREIAFRRFATEGIRLTTTESVLFELTRVAGTPEFKEISRLVK